jgi:DNA-binding NtrC family response regulator
MQEFGRATALAPVPRTSSHPGLRDLLLISPLESDRLMLAKVVPAREWHILHVHTCEEALAVMASILVPVVVCDEKAAGGHWKRAVKTVISSPHPAPTVLASDSHDWHLWVDLIEHGGFDVIGRPFVARDVEEKLHGAFNHWREGRVRRTWDHFFA